MKNINKNDKGFTLIEMVIVIAVIVILAAILIPTFANVIGDANEAKVQSELKNAYTAYIVEHTDVAPDGYSVIFLYEDEYYRLNEEGEYVTVDTTQAEKFTDTEIDKSGKVTMYKTSVSVVWLLVYEEYKATVADPQDTVTMEKDGKYYIYDSNKITEVSDALAIESILTQDPVLDSTTYGVKVYDAG